MVETLCTVRRMRTWIALVAAVAAFAAMALSGCTARQEDLSGQTVYLQIEAVAQNTLTGCRGTLERMQDQTQTARYVFVPGQQQMSLSLESAIDAAGRTVRVQTLASGTILAVTFGSDNTVAQAVVRDDIITQQQAQQLVQQAQEKADAAQTIAADTVDADGTYVSNQGDENALRMENGAVVSLKRATVQKTGDAASDADALYTGGNAAVLAHDGAALTLTDGTVQSDGADACGIVVTGADTCAVLDDCVVTTKGDNACAAGVYMATLQIDGGVYATEDANTPALCVAGDATVSDATLKAAQSQALRVYTPNSVQLFDTTVQSGGTAGAVSFCAQDTEHMNTAAEQAAGSGTLTMIGGAIQASGGAYFCVEDTQTQIGLETVDMQGGDVLLQVSGQNADCTLHAATQKLKGDVLTQGRTSLVLTDFSVWEGAVPTHAADASVQLSMDQTCTWSLTADSYLDAFEGDLSCVQTNGYTLYVAGTAVK